jgi:molybdopterin-binding protein
VTPIVEVSGVRVAHASRVILEVSHLAVRPGEVLVVIGPNGAGKSTLLRVMGLLQTPDAGAVRFQGETVTAAQGLSVRRRMASVFQEPLLADTTVFENVAMGLTFRGAPRRRIVTEVARWLGRLGVAGLADRSARTLSGGEAQRVALARALVLEPDLLLLDEPFSALDQPTREVLIDDLGRILREDHVSTALVTHDRAEAMTLGDRVGVMIRGRLVQVEDTSQVFRAPLSEEIARFVGVETILDCRAVRREDGVTVLDGGGQSIVVAAPAEPGEIVRLCLRPEDVTLSTAGPEPGSSSARNHLTGRVLRVTASGPYVRVIVDCGFPLVALVTQRSVDELGLHDGAAVVAHFKATAAHLLRGRASLDTRNATGV